MSTDEILEVLRKARMDTNAAMQKINEAINAIAAMPQPPDPKRKCDQCGVLMRGPNALAEHIHISHGGPVPEAWLRTERLAGITEEVTT